MTLEDVTYSFSRNVGNILPLTAKRHDVADRYARNVGTKTTTKSQKTLDDVTDRFSRNVGKIF